MMVENLRLELFFWFNFMVIFFQMMEIYDRQPLQSNKYFLEIAWILPKIPLFLQEDLSHSEHPLEAEP